MVSRLGWSVDERGLGVRKQEIKTREGIKRRKGEKETHMIRDQETASTLQKLQGYKDDAAAWEASEMEEVKGKEEGEKS